MNINQIAQQTSGRMKARRWVLVFAWVAALLLGGIPVAPIAHADTFGVVGQNGYYDGVWHDWANHTWVMDHGIPLDWNTPDYTTDVTTVDEFVSFMQTLLNNPANPNGDAARASAIVNMMMGVRTDDPRLGPPSPTRWQIGITLAQSLFPQWEQTVRNYANGSIPGASVNFDEMVFMPFGSINGFGVATDASGAVAMSDVIFGPVHDEGTEEMIVFHHPDGTTFTIKKKCANMTGVESAFPSSVMAAVGISAGPSLSGLQPGDSVDMNITLTNTTPLAPSLPGRVEAYRPAQVAIPCAGNPCSPSNQNDFVGVTTGKGYATNSTLASGYSGPNWFWTVSSIPGGSSYTASFRFQISPAAPSGNFTFPICFAPANAVGGVTCTTVSYSVSAPRSPYFAAEKGDIHAGGHVAAGGVCTPSASSASVRGNAGSYGDYVITATGLISSNVSSNGAGGGSALKLGNTGAGGGYAEVCRPDLLAMANAYTGTVNLIPDPSNFSVSGRSGVWKYTGGGTLHISGQIDQSITIVTTSPAAIVQFDANIRVNPALNVPARDMPGLGVIAAGGIRISSAVTQLDAYLFSSAGVIDTCYQVNSSCSNGLTVNGFLMAADILFGRLGAAGTSGQQLAERIILTPQVYLNPPPLFSGSAGNVFLDSQGEYQPLF